VSSRVCARVRSMSFPRVHAVEESVKFLQERFSVVVFWW
jgi:hypothetical protein